MDMENETLVEKEVVDEEIVANVDPPFSFAAGILGWTTAMFAFFAILALGLDLLDTQAFNGAPARAAIGLSQPMVNALTSAGVAIVLLATFLAFLVGGYAAGRINRAFGLVQGAIVVAWTIVATFIGNAMTSQATRASDLGILLQPFAIDWANVSTASGVVIVVALLVALGGAVLGGWAGVRWTRRATVVATSRHWRSGWRGRPGT